MIALALIKADTPKTDPVLSACIATIQKRFTGSGYSPQRTGGHDVYEAAVVAMALSNLDSEEHRGEINRWRPTSSDARRRMDRGTTPTGPMGIRRSPSTPCSDSGNATTRGSRFLPRSGTGRQAGTSRQQASGGSWNYHRDQPQYLEDLSMTAAGVGSLLLCKRQLERFRQAKRGNNPLLTPIAPENPFHDYEITTSLVQIDQAARKGMAWLAANYYHHRDQAASADRFTMVCTGSSGSPRSPTGRRSARWTCSRRARSFIRSTQKPDGSWHAPPMTTT